MTGSVADVSKFNGQGNGNPLQYSHLENPMDGEAFDCVDHNKLWKILKVMGIPDHLTCPLICHSGYLTYVQGTSCKMLGRMKHKMESRLPGEISITSDMQITPPF